MLSTFHSFRGFQSSSGPVLIQCTSQRITWVVDQPGVGEARGILIRSRLRREPKAGLTALLLWVGLTLLPLRTLGHSTRSLQIQLHVESWMPRALERFLEPPPSALLPGRFYSRNPRFLSRGSLEASESSGGFPSSEGKAKAARGSSSQSTPLACSSPNRRGGH